MLKWIQSCLYYYVLDDIVDHDVYSLPTYQLIPYCLFESTVDHLDLAPSENETHIHYYLTFAELKRRQTSVDQMIAWSVSMDLVERYQIFLDGLDESLSSQIVPNCTKGWFGSRCQYTFYADDFTFAELIRKIFLEKLADENRKHFTNGTCYVHLACDHGPRPACLDWREICDGKWDCLDGVDEPQACLEREANKCVEGYYRCHNGQCIPNEFYHDGDLLNPDCADWTDIEEYPSDGLCPADPAFRCEEHICSKNGAYDCGDGRCTAIQHYMIEDCKHNRFSLAYRHLFDSQTNSHLSPMCSSIMTCMSTAGEFLGSRKKCNTLCNSLSKCVKLATAHCPSVPFVFPWYPVLLGHVRLVYTINATLFEDDPPRLKPFLICFNEQLCGPILGATIHYQNYTCRFYADLIGDLPGYYWGELLETSDALFRKCAATLLINCTMLFQCPNSPKCISTHRLLDGIYDCFDHRDEEVNETCALMDPYRFQCPSKPSDCLSPVLLNNKQNNCPHGEDEQLAKSKGYTQLPPFPMLCDARLDMNPIFVDGREQTDETDCKPHFPCDNIYTRCDGFWHCDNGIDEANCSSTLCPPMHHPCISFVNKSIGCLPIELANDGIVHCRGGSDERHICRQRFPNDHERRYLCADQKRGCARVETLCSHALWENYSEDDHCGDQEETVCPEIYFHDDEFLGICYGLPNFQPSVAEKILCSLDEEIYLLNYNYTDNSMYLRLIRTGNFPEQVQTADAAVPEIRGLPHSHQLPYLEDRTWFCNRGIVIFVGGRQQRQCLCPPTYYGDRCQFQNQRVSLALKFITLDSLRWRTAFYLLVMLLDDDSVVQSYQDLIYVPVRDCGVKFHIYLTYASQPKSSAKRYTVIIHAYDKQDLTARTSWQLSIAFPFLPVEHQVARLIIPEKTVHNSATCHLPCGQHGECERYENTKEEFCRCRENWWGPHCNQQYSCNCSPESKCIGIIGNQSICLCPWNRFGLRCYRVSSRCQSDTCKHGGTCILADDRLPTQNVTCLCREGYIGARCEFSSTRIDISFEHVNVPDWVYGHFIDVRNDEPHVRTTIYQKVPYDQTRMTLYRVEAFHLLFLEFSHQYYLGVLQQKYRAAAIITTQVLPSHRCSFVDALLNETILNYNRLRRIKYYHLPCQQNFALQCFYDEEYMCLCNLDHHANCFDFDHNMTYTCHGVNYCHNNGKCFQNHPTCPTASVCTCDECFFGSRCQRNTKGYDISLDIILGYHIHSHLTFTRQPWSLKFSVIVTLVMFVVGLVSGSLSLMVFQPKHFKVGCDVYLFIASITSLLSMITLAVQLLLLILSHTGFIDNRTILLIICISVHFLVKLLPTLFDWSCACIAIERAYTTCKGLCFSQSKSLYTAKRMVFLVVVLLVASAIHDPIHRRSINDDEEHRVWCIVEYSPTWKFINRMLNVCHLLVPFFSNLASALLIIITTARRRSAVRKNQNYIQHLVSELQQHKHLLISSCVLVILAFPRLFVSFAFRCMKSARDPWWFLFAYYIPFIPPTSILLIYVLPSDTYQKLLKSILRNAFPFCCDKARA